MKKKNYEAPIVKVVNVEVELGFAQSFVDGNFIINLHNAESGVGIEDMEEGNDNDGGWII